MQLCETQLFLISLSIIDREAFKKAIKSFQLLLLLSNSAMGQNYEPGKIRFSLGYGAGLIQMKEENLIPNMHRGVAAFLNFCIEKRNYLYRWTEETMKK